MRLVTLAFTLLLFSSPAFAGDPAAPPPDGGQAIYLDDDAPNPAVPEPGAALLMGAGLLTIGLAKRMHGAD